MGAIRRAAVAGQFYPGNAGQLISAIEGYLGAVETADDQPPKAIIAPHAGYVYSGPIAATAYARLKPARGIVTRVILLGPCHRVPVRGIALSGADYFQTPLGNIPVDTEASEAALELPQVAVFDATHEMEHSLEVHLPFLQVVLGDFKVVPLVVGETSPESAGEVIEALWGGPETLIVVSSDLSHYLDYESAREIDGRTCTAIENFDPGAIERHGACGRFPVSGLLDVARKRGLEVTTLDLRNSGDTAGSKDRVVGYGAWMFAEPKKKPEPKPRVAVVQWNSAPAPVKTPKSAAETAPPPEPEMKESETATEAEPNDLESTQEISLSELQAAEAMERSAAEGPTVEAAPRETDAESTPADERDLPETADLESTQEIKVSMAAEEEPAEPGSAGLETTQEIRVQLTPKEASEEPTPEPGAEAPVETKMQPEPYPPDMSEADFEAATRELLERHGESLLLLAALSIDHGLEHGKAVPVDFSRHPTELRRIGACFVTLKKAGQLRGCIGSPVAHRALVEDVAENAFRAAFGDPRFKPLSADERDDIDISLSILSPQVEMSFTDEDDFMNQLRPGVDGLVIEDRGLKALFLPSVWSQLPHPKNFMGRLKVKAGLQQDHWSDRFRAWRFIAEEISADKIGG